ncbi:MAG: PadR family transcriptional regulator [Aeromicrobium erythreum]
MPAELTATASALLGLLAFDAQTSEEGLTGYELKQRADRTLRFYWVSPATSQIYTELERLEAAGLVASQDTSEGRRPARRFRITPDGRTSLQEWLERPDPEQFPALKHPVALRLLMGALTSPERLDDLLADYLERLDERAEELGAVRAMLADRTEVRYPARVAEWGLAYYASEREIVERLRTEIAAERDASD